MRRAHAEELATQVAGLSSLDTAALKDRWRSLYGAAPPPNVSRGLLIRAVAYRLQENALGGLRPQTRRRLDRVGQATQSSQELPAPRRRPSPGTRIVREWQGVTYHVLVTDKGVLFRDKHYRSLSEVARIITGTRWSGPRFFGLDGKANGHVQS
jgi:hypothetical protein